VGYGSLLDRRRLEETRDNTGASIMGANTLRTENPEMRGTNGTLSPDRIRAIISRSGLIPVTGKKLFDHGPQPVIFTGEENMSALQDRLKDKARVLSLPEGPHGLSLQAALDIFAGRGVESLLIEGGAQLNYAFADGPKYLGDPFLELELLSSEPVSTGELFLRYRIKKME
jgi:riboflavin biosynthesis pyrimidine reductase